MRPKIVAEVKAAATVREEPVSAKFVRPMRRYEKSVGWREAAFALSEPSATLRVAAAAPPPGSALSLWHEICVHAAETASL